MAKQDDWVRITLRLPKTLHRALVTLGNAASLNAEIVDRLIESVVADDHGPHRVTVRLDPLLHAVLMKEVEESGKPIFELISDHLYRLLLPDDVTENDLELIHLERELALAKRYVEESQASLMANSARLAALENARSDKLKEIEAKRGQ